MLPNFSTPAVKPYPSNSAIIVYVLGFYGLLCALPLGALAEVVVASGYAPALAMWLFNEALGLGFIACVIWGVVALVRSLLRRKG